MIEQDNKSNQTEVAKRFLTDLPYDSLLEITNFFGSPKELMFFLETCKVFWEMQFEPEFQQRLFANVTFSFSLKRIKIQTKKLNFVQKIWIKNVAVQDNHLKKLNDLFPNLSSINLTGCRGISDEGIKFLKGIKTIVLYNCDQITDESLKHLKGIED